MLGTNPTPVTVKVNAGLPIGTVGGSNDTTTGFTSSVTLFDCLPSGFFAVMEKPPDNVIRLAGTLAVSCVELPNVVLSGVEPHETMAPKTKFAPAIDRVAPPAPAFNCVGEMEPIDGGPDGEPSETVNVSAFELAPPALTTVTEYLPADAMADAGTCAVSCVLLTNMVLRAVLFHQTMDPETKPLPLTVRVRSGPPARVEAGLREVMTTGTGVTCNISGLEA